MIPSPLIDWAVWANLDRHPDMELILLKGHLLLEIVLTDSLRRQTSLTVSQIKNLSFHAKTQVLARTDAHLSDTMAHAKQLNRLRNQVAHEPFVQALEAELASWSEQVLAVYAIQKHQRYTRRTRLTQAIAALARSVYESAYDRDSHASHGPTIT